MAKESYAGRKSIPLLLRVWDMGRLHLVLLRQSRQRHAFRTEVHTQYPMGH